MKEILRNLIFDLVGFEHRFNLSSEWWMATHYNMIDLTQDGLSTYWQA